MKERGISKEKVWETYKSADTQSKKGNGAFEQKKKFGNCLITIITKKNENQEVIIVSVWMDPPLPGSKDAKQKEFFKKYQRAGFWGKLWYIFLRQLGF